MNLIGSFFHTVSSFLVANHSSIKVHEEITVPHDHEMYPLLLRLSTASLTIFSRGLICSPSAMSFFDPTSALTSPGCVSLGNLQHKGTDQGSGTYPDT